MTPRNPSTHNRLPNLDGIRAIAVTAVVVCHAVTLSGVSLANWLEPIFKHGSFGVDLFFILSGYLTTYLFCKEYRKNGKIDLKAFFIRRAFRILPPLLAFLATISTLFYFGVLTASWSDIIAGLLLYKNYINGAPAFGSGWYSGHLWSLSLENQFYLVVPVIFALLSPLRSRRLLLILALSMPLMRVGCYYFAHQERGLLTLMFHTAADRLLWGCVLALYEDQLTKGMANRVLQSPVFFCAAILNYFIILPHLNLSLGGPFVLTVGMTLKALNIVYVILWLKMNLTSVASRFLNHKIPCAIGTISYSVYLWQQLVLSPLSSLPAWCVPIGIGLCYGVGAVSYKLLEAPFANLRKRHSATKLAPPLQPFASTMLREKEPVS